MTARWRGTAGFSLVEMLVASLILVVIIAGVFAIVDPTRSVSVLQPEAADVRQRLRVSAETLSREIRVAGAGPYRGPDESPLPRYRPAILPYRIGRSRPDPPQGVFYRPDAITLVHVPAVPARQPPDEALYLRPDGSLAAQFDRADALAQVVVYTYYWRAASGGDSDQLRRYDGLDTDSPVVDHVVRLAFAYEGEPMPPRVLADPAEDPAAVPRTTYGPSPPAIGTDVPGDLWGPGENCLFAVVDGVHASRLATLGGPGALVELSPGSLTDGPWCPDPLAAERWDADLLRIRRVRAIVRVEASASAFRGPAGPLFTRGGTSRSALMFLPDLEIAFEVTPPNLQAAP